MDLIKMRTIILLFLSLTVLFVIRNQSFAGESISATVASDANIGPVAAAIDKRCYEEIGVEIVSLGLLVDANRGSFFLLSNLYFSAFFDTDSVGALTATTSRTDRSTRLASTI